MENLFKENTLIVSKKNRADISIENKEKMLTTFIDEVNILKEEFEIKFI